MVKNMLKNKILSVIQHGVRRLGIVLQQGDAPAPGAASYAAFSGSDPTRASRAKNRVVATAAIASLFVMFTAVATVRDLAPFGPLDVAVEPLEVSGVSIGSPSTEADRYWYEERFGRGDTFAALLMRLHLNAPEVSRVMRDAGGSGLLPHLRPGTAVQANVSAAGQLHSLRFVGAQDQQLGLDRTERGFRAVEKPVKLERQIVARAAFVGNSLFAAADAAGVPDSVATQLGEVFGSTVDFHRDLRRSDRFTVVFELFTHQGRVIRPGRLLAAEVMHGKRVLRAVWFESGDQHGYYTPDGQSLKSAFLRTPLEVSRITSGFEMRFDPRSRQWHAHNGIDYAAPIGTPVRATGDGTVQFLGQQAGYGNLITLKHRGETTTYYAHLDQFAAGLKTGDRVAQGQTIGTVGQTGWATGPHLHYEFRIRDEHVDPLNIALPSATPLDRRQAAQFRSQANLLVARLDLLKNTVVAALE